MGLDLSQFAKRYRLYVVPTGEFSCWKWNGYFTKSGYPRLRNPTNRPSHVLAHRISYVLHRGPIPKDKHVLHKCDNPECTNPKHLFIGTHRDNMLDKERKGRANHPSILTIEKVRAIKNLLELGTLSQREIGLRFGVKRETITNINNGLCWKHVR